MTRIRDMRTREQWLNRGVELLNAEVFTPADMGIAAHVRVSVGFPSGRGGRNNAIGQCWSPSVSADQTIEMFISPSIDDPIRVLDILAHEMIHAIVGLECGHKGPFKRLANEIGLVGKMTATTAGDDLKAKLQTIADKIGEYPHSKLDPKGKSSAPKQTTRLLKIECPYSECDNIARQSAKAFEQFGLRCDACDVAMVCYQ